MPYTSSLSLQAVQPCSPQTRLCCRLCSPAFPLRDSPAGCAALHSRHHYFALHCLFPGCPWVSLTSLGIPAYRWVSLGLGVPGYSSSSLGVPGSPWVSLHIRNHTNPFSNIVMERAWNVRNTTFGFINFCQSHKSLVSEVLCKRVEQNDL